MITIFMFATNIYSTLGLRFVHKFYDYYTGSIPVKFTIVSDISFKTYLPEHADKIREVPARHFDWLSAVNARFHTFLDLDFDTPYVFHLDADTNINKPFNLDHMLHPIVGGEHFANRTWMKDKKNYDRTARSMAYIPETTSLPQIYYLGAFWGGSVPHVKEMCKTLVAWQAKDKTWGYEPAVNDESYLNAYFHYNPPHLITLENFPFLISCKGGISHTRDMTEPQRTQNILSKISQQKGKWDFHNGDIINRS